MYNLKIGTGPNSEILSADTVLISICGKYKDMCSNCSRTLLIDATNEQKEAYIFISEVFSVLHKALKPGVKINEVYQTCIKFCNEKQE